MQVISTPPPRINIAYLEQFPEFVEFRRPRGTSNRATEVSVTTSNETPEVSLEIAYQRVREDLFAELLQMVKAGSAQFFEQRVVDLLVWATLAHVKTQVEQLVAAEMVASTV